MDTERPTVALHQDFKVAAGLRRLHDAKTISASRDWHVGGIVAGNLQKYAAVRTTLVRLPSRVQEAGPVPQTCCHLLGIPYSLADGLQRLLMCVVHLNVGRDTEIVS